MALRELFAAFTIQFPKAELKAADAQVDRTEAKVRRLGTAIGGLVGRKGALASGGFGAGGLGLLMRPPDLRWTDRFSAWLRGVPAQARPAAAAVGRVATPAPAESGGAFGGLRGAMGGLAALYGVKAGLSTVTALGSELESSTAVIAGMLAQFGKSSDFHAGLTDAGNIIRQIEKDAARLPGEADEYIEVFRAGLPGVAQAMKGATTLDMAGFTNQFTAIAKSLRIDAQQAGRDLDRMLMARGQAGAENRTFMSLLPSMRIASGDQGLDAAKFNTQTQAARLALIQAAISTDAMRKMVDHMGDSFDAQWGGFKANLKLWTRATTKGLFEGIKDVLKATNEWSDRLQALTRHVNMARVGGAALAAVLAIVGGKLLALAAANPVLLGLIVGVIAFALAWDEVKTTLEGGDSVLKRFLVTHYGVDGAKAKIEQLRGVWESLRYVIETAGHAFDWFIRAGEIIEGLKLAVEDLGDALDNLVAGGLRKLGGLFNETKLGGFFDRLADKVVKENAEATTARDVARGTAYAPDKYAADAEAVAELARRRRARGYSAAPTNPTSSVVLPGQMPGAGAGPWSGPGGLVTLPPTQRTVNVQDRSTVTLSFEGSGTPTAGDARAISSAVGMAIGPKKRAAYEAVAGPNASY